MSGTPFVQLQEPHILTGYDRKKLPSEQPASVSKTFIDAMTVREEVFVKEQGVNLEYELDDDDQRSCHWVVYASIRKITQQEQIDPRTGKVLVPRQSKTKTTPIGTLRLVPFPHPPHPKPGGKYFDGKLVNGGEEMPPGSDLAPGNAPGSGQKRTVEPLTEEEKQRMASSQPYGHDRPTSLHDGREPYMKLGRLAVLKEFRGQGVSALLVSEAFKWLRAHPTYFNPSVAKIGLDALGALNTSDIPKWDGLVCVHAQEQVVKVWERFGFQLDQEMGKWWEEGMPHVGMFRRLDGLEERF